MKRFVTYLYEYRDGEKQKNKGHIRVDVRGQVLDMRVSIKDAELDEAKGNFFIITKNNGISTISLAEILMQNGEYRGRIVCDCGEQKDRKIQLEEIVGVCVYYENACYMASCWKDGEEQCIADGFFLKKNISEERIENPVEEPVTNIIEEESAVESFMAAAAISEEIIEDTKLEAVLYEKKLDIEPEARTEPEHSVEPCYRKINLNEIYALPSNYWHYSNNSFLLHGFWNYGYLVVKENAAETEKRAILGVPGIFERPEKVMASYFGFPKFEALSSQMEEMEIGESCPCAYEKNNQPPQENTFGCWFIDL